jgi:hypothetical protein
MTDCRDHALTLLEVEERAELSEHKMQAHAVAQMWLDVAVIKESLALSPEQAEPEAPQSNFGR